MKSRAEIRASSHYEKEQSELFRLLATMCTKIYIYIYVYSLKFFELFV